ncbi:MAG: response regulator transcription factor [Hyphomicrobiales bacterium]
MMDAKRLLMVESDDTLGEALSEQLTLSGEFTVQTVAAIADAIEIAKRNRFDLVLIDADPPAADEQGNQGQKGEPERICDSVLMNGVKAPIIMLVAQGPSPEAISCTGESACHCVAKPLRFSVLLARIRAALDPHGRRDAACSTIGPYRFQPAMNRLIHDDGSVIQLTSKETAILQFLNKAEAGIVNREVLLREIWGYNERVMTHTLETHIYHLRRKMQGGQPCRDIVLSEAGGYRLCRQHEGNSRMETES